MPRRVLQGVITSDKMDKTVTVSVERRIMHSKYKKFIRQTKKYAAHDEKNEYKEGQIVEIQECRPLSKRKKWQVLRAVNVNTSGAGKQEKPAKAKKQTQEE